MKSCEAHRQYYWLTLRGANDSLSKWRKQVDLNRGKTWMATAWLVSLSHLIGRENEAILDDQWQSRKNVAIQYFLRHCMIKIKRNILNFHLEKYFSPLYRIITHYFLYLQNEFVVNFDQLSEEWWHQCSKGDLLLLFLICIVSKKVWISEARSENRCGVRVWRIGRHASTKNFEELSSPSGFTQTGVCLGAVCVRMLQYCSSV